MSSKYKAKVVIGQIGVGGWGPNLLRNFFELSDVKVKTCCDLNPAILAGIKNDYPDAMGTENADEIINDPEIDAVVIATPAPTHFALAKKMLQAKKHLFVEKPLTLNIAEAAELIVLAKKVDRKLMVGHLLLYHPAVTKLKQLIADGELGEIYYIYTQRLNLGKIRSTENVWWSLAPHDVSVILYLLGQPVAVSAVGSAFIQPRIQDVVFSSLKFEGGQLAQIHVSWLDPTKTRRTIIVGSKKMAIFDEMESRNTLRLFDKGVEIRPEFKSFEEFCRLRFGKEETIEIERTEPLRIECQHFIDCIKQDRQPLSDGENGLAVLRVLNAAQNSLNKGGQSELL